MWDTDSFAEKLDLVKAIIVQLAQGMKYLTPEERAAFEMDSMPVEAFMESDGSTITASDNGRVYGCLLIFTAEANHRRGQAIVLAIRRSQKVPF